jgi:hypothetical protein
VGTYITPNAYGFGGLNQNVTTTNPVTISLQSVVVT